MRHWYRLSTPCAVLCSALLGLCACRRSGPVPANVAPPPADGLVRVGSITIDAADLDTCLKDRYDGRTDDGARRLALAELTRRAQFAQAALDAGMGRDPVVRQEMARLLEARLRERQLHPRIKAVAAISETRLRELYGTAGTRFQSSEQRQVAVLWLDPGRNPERAQQYGEKLAQARAWLLGDEALRTHPGQGFGVLSVDYSEHAATRYTGGSVGWLESVGGMDPWRRVVAELAFRLEDVGDVGSVTTRPEGVFLVRLMDRKPATSQPFEAVAPLLEQEERSRVIAGLESAFLREIEAAHPVDFRAEP